MVHCIVPGCNSDTKQKRNISFHEFPCNEAVRSQWLKAISRKDYKNGSKWVPKQHSCVCGLHFSNESFKPNMKRKVLMKNAVPSIFPTNPTHLLKKETTPRHKIEKVAIDIYNLPIVERIQKEQSCDFKIFGEGTIPRREIQNAALDVDNHPIIERTKRVEEQSYDFEISREKNTPRPEIKKVALDVNNHPVVERINKVEEQSYDFEIFGESPPAQTPLEQKYSSVDLSRLERRCLFLNKKLLNKNCVLSKTRKKLTASKEKYNSLLKTYKNLLSEYQSLNLDKLNQMNASNWQRQFLLDQLSVLSKKRPKWSESTIRTCILWYAVSPDGYRFVRDIGLLKLPSKTTLKLSESTLKLSHDTNLSL